MFFAPPFLTNGTAMKPNALFNLLTAAFTVATITVSAQVTNPLQLAYGFDVFTKTSMTLQQGQTSGAIAVGGNLNVNNQTTIAMNNAGEYPSGSANSNNYSMVVNGRVFLNGGNTTYINQGYLRIGDLTGVKMFDKDNNSNTNLQVVPQNSGFNNNLRLHLQRYQDKSTVNTPHNIDFATSFNQFLFNTDLINSYPSNSSCSTNFNFVTIPNTQNPHITLTANKINYINLTESQLSNLNNLGSIIFDQAPSATRMLIINVTLTTGTYNWSVPNMGGIGTSDAAFVLFNFHNATSLTISGSNAVYGTIYAPRADVSKTNNNNSNGQIIANSFALNAGLVQTYPFKGTFPDCGGTTIMNNYNNARTGGGQPLPIKDITLTATANTFGTALGWNVTQEQDVADYVAEKSTDARTFTSFQTVMAKGNAAERNYTAEDKDAAGKETYYRVKVNFTNGTHVYSNIVRVTRTADISATTLVYPNPFHSSLNVRVNTDGQVLVRLTDIAGRVISNQTVTNKAGEAINIPVAEGLANGTYFLQVFGADQSLIASKTLVKN